MTFLCNYYSIIICVFNMKVKICSLNMKVTIYYLNMKVIVLEMTK